jgi:transglutaminase-like putative cysteine protease
VVCGLSALVISGGVGPVFTLVYAALLVVSWKLENTTWQISERLGTALVILVVPGFYTAWKFNLFGFATNESALAGVLAEVILGLALIKLLQRKRDRDWLFLYLMAFFEILLSAALSISPMFLAVLVVYLLITAVAIIAFEIRKSASSLASRTPSEVAERLDAAPFRRLPSTAVLLIAAVTAVAAPVFFMLPRVGGAGLGANQNSVSGMTGFSDRVRLGEIGRILQSDETVMRVKVETRGETVTGLRWRGIALDQFDHKTWRQSRPRKQTYIRGDRDAFLVGFRFTKPRLVFQSIYLEPMDTPVLFTLPHPILVQGNFNEIRKDEDDGLTVGRHPNERINYSVQSDLSFPPPEQLRADQSAYPADEFVKYLQLPDDLDPRIAELANEISGGQSNRFDKAAAVEQHLQTKFGYTLEQKAAGAQPVADFLFNVREGHCEYFSSAMVLMLRTQGIAARVVNGFQQGTYNRTADVFVVKQKDAHSWVEVYFPKERAWVAFDPTPFAGRSDGTETAGLLGSLRGYLEALETFWIQYFVAYDDKEQSSLFRSVKDGFSGAQDSVTVRFEELQARLRDWWSAVSGERGLAAGLAAAGYGAGYLAALVAAVWLLSTVFRRERLARWWKIIAGRLRARRSPGIVEFYDRMVRILARQGFERAACQTPLEFASALPIPEAVAITEKYNRVRFGGKDLSAEEAAQIESMLGGLESRRADSA